MLAPQSTSTQKLYQYSRGRKPHQVQVSLLLMEPSLPPTSLLGRMVRKASYGKPYLVKKTMSSPTASLYTLGW